MGDRWLRISNFTYKIHFNITISIGRTTVAHINGYELYLNTTLYPIFNMQTFRYCLSFVTILVRWYPHSAIAQLHPLFTKCTYGLILSHMFCDCCDVNVKVTQGSLVLYTYIHVLLTSSYRLGIRCDQNLF